MPRSGDEPPPGSPSGDEPTRAALFNAKLLGDISTDDFEGLALLAPGRFTARPGQYLSLGVPARVNVRPPAVHECTVIDGVPAAPGPFVCKSLRFHQPLLRRTYPIAGCVYQADTNDTRVELSARIAEPFGAELARARPMSPVSVMGPLGSGFRIDEARPAAALVGEGMGIGPMMFLADRMAVLRRPSPALFCQEGGTDAPQRLERHFVGHETDLEEAIIYAAGPLPLLAGLAGVAARLKIPCQVLLEVPMPCGTGACQGCAVPTRAGYRPACTAGPVFDAADVLWEELRR